MESDHVGEHLTKYLKSVQSFLAQYSSNQNTVDDLVQDTFTQALQIIRSNGAPEKPLAWLLTIAYRTAQHSIAAAQRRKAQHLSDTKYRVANWSDYDRSLVERGKLTLWLTPAAMATWNAKPTRRRGGQTWGPRRQSGQEPHKTRLAFLVQPPHP